MVPPANCFTVLVIDDMPANRVLLRKVLNGAGYAVLEATNGDDALALLEGRALLPDLIVTDIEMPGMDGITLVDRLRHLDSPSALIPVIAASGNSDELMRRNALAVGCDVFLTKPFDLSVLRREIGSLIKERRQSMSARSDAPASGVALNRIELRLRETK
jgi:CheY-like chemotaxis protein